MSHFIFSEELCFAAFIDSSIILMLSKENINRFMLVHTSDFRIGYPIDDNLEITNHNYKIYDFDKIDSSIGK